MKTRRPLSLLPLLLLLTTLLHHPTVTQSLIDPTAFSTMAPAPTTISAPAPINTVPTNNDTEFIRANCASTRYPDVCYNSLSGYASAIQQNPAQLARVAIAISLSETKHATTHFSNLSKEADYGADHLAAAALHDCFSVFGDAVDQIHGSLNEMRHLVGGSGETFKLQMSNVQTWMSAALTNQDTCTDGFDDVRKSPMKTDVCDRVQKVEAVTSNALALVNCFAAKVSTDSSP